MQIGFKDGEGQFKCTRRFQRAECGIMQRGIVNDKQVDRRQQEGMSMSICGYKFSRGRNERGLPISALLIAACSRVSVSVSVCLLVV